MARRVIYRVLFVWSTIPGEKQISQIAADNEAEARQLFALGHKAARIIDVCPWEHADVGRPPLSNNS